MNADQMKLNSSGSPQSRADSTCKTISYQEGRLEPAAEQNPYYNINPYRMYKQNYTTNYRQVVRYTADTARSLLYVCL